MKEYLPYSIVFSDESTFIQDLYLGKVWRKRGSDITQGYVECKAHPISCMFWGCIGFNFKSEIIPIEGTINSESYIQLLEKSNIFKILEEKFNSQYIFMQDGARPHTAQKTLEYMKGKVNLLENWPSLSPDLNPIEHLWSLIMKMLKGKRFKNREELILAVKEQWEKIPMDIINKLISSWQARLIVCERIGGRCLNGHWGEVHQEHQRLCPYSFCKNKDWPF